MTLKIETHKTRLPRTDLLTFHYKSSTIYYCVKQIVISTVSARLDWFTPADLALSVADK